MVWKGIESRGYVDVTEVIKQVGPSFIDGLMLTSSVSSSAWRTQKLECSDPCSVVTFQLEFLEDAGHVFFTSCSLVREPPAIAL